MLKGSLDLGWRVIEIRLRPRKLDCFYPQGRDIEVYFLHHDSGTHIRTPLLSKCKYDAPSSSHAVGTALESNLPSISRTL